VFSAALLFILVLPAFAARDSQYFLDKGNLYLKEGHPESALKYFQEAVELDPGNAEAHNNLGQVYARKNMLDDAQTHLLKALELKPNYVEALSNLSYVYLQRRVFSASEKYARTALRFDPSYAPARYNLGLTYLESGKYQDALTAIKVALQAMPPSAEVSQRLGDTYRALRNYEEALAYYRQAASIDAASPGLQEKIGDMYAVLGQEVRAIERYHMSSELSPERIPTHYRLAEYDKDQRDWDKALMEYLMILSVDDRQAVAHREAAKIYERKDMSGLALEHWGRYCKMNPDDQDAKKHMEDLRKPLMTHQEMENQAAFNKTLDEAKAKEDAQAKKDAEKSGAGKPKGEEIYDPLNDASNSVGIAPQLADPTPPPDEQKDANGKKKKKKSLWAIPDATPTPVPDTAPSPLPPVPQ
jgi:tetratricopeptide (TPR) repeat protein